jgi:hypothetical protein
MFTKTVVLVVAVCGIGAIPALAQDESRIFQWSPVARPVGQGQYRAEIWRRENASGNEDRAWMSSDLHASSTEAMAAACATLRKNFDDSFSCTQTSRDAKARKVEESRPREENGSKTPPAISPVPTQNDIATASQPGSNNWTAVVKQVWAAASQSGSGNWAKEFWANQSKWGHGGGDGGAGGGGGGCQ